MLLNLLLLLLNVHVLELMFEYNPTGSQRHSRLETRLSAGPLSPALCFFQSRLCITIYSTVCFALRLCWGISLDALDRWDIAVMRSSSLLHGLLLTLPTFLENYFRKWDSGERFCGFVVLLEQNHYFANLFFPPN